MMTPKVRFRTKLSEHGVERLELARALRALRARLQNGADTRLPILESANGSWLRFRALLYGGGIQGFLGEAVDLAAKVKDGSTLLLAHTCLKAVSRHRPLHSSV